MFIKKNKEKLLKNYEDENGEYVFLINPKTGKEEKKYIRDLIVATFGNANEYDKMREKNGKHN